MHGSVRAGPFTARSESGALGREANLPVCGDFADDPPAPPNGGILTVNDLSAGNSLEVTARIAKPLRAAPLTVARSKLPTSTSPTESCIRQATSLPGNLGIRPSRFATMGVWNLLGRVFQPILYSLDPTAARDWLMVAKAACRADLGLRADRDTS